MKFFTIPEDVDVVMTRHCPTCRREPEGGEKRFSMSFHKWINALIEDPSLWKKPKDIKAALKLQEVFSEEATKPKAVVLVEDADHEKLFGVYENPSFAYHPHVMKKCRSFMEAFEKPLDKDPREPVA